MTIQTYEEAFAFLVLQEKHPQYNTWNISRAVEVLGHPERAFKSVHITGTNGKGSVTRMVYQVLREAWYTVGCFISPHLLDHRERFVVNDMWIDDESFIKIISKIASLELELSRFEKYVLVAFEFFKLKKVDYAVIEVWVWAKNDATNVLIPEVSAITSLGFDHAKTLWSTLDDIAEHKAGIIKSWVPVVLWVYHPLFEMVAREKGSQVVYPMDEKPTNMLGEYQKKNAGIAYEICTILWIDDTVILNWLQKVRHRWRLEYVWTNLLIDGAHNIDGLQALRTYIESIEADYSDIFYCFALKKNKTCDLVLDTFGKKKNYVIVWYQQDILLPIEELTSQMKERSVDPQVLSVEKIRQRAKSQPKNLFVVFGSLYMIWQFLKD